MAETIDLALARARPAMFSFFGQELHAKHDVTINYGRSALRPNQPVALQSYRGLGITLPSHQIAHGRGENGKTSAELMLTIRRYYVELIARLVRRLHKVREGNGTMLDNTQVKRLLALPDDEKPRILRCFREYFGYHKAPEVFKNAEDFKDHAPNVLVSDTDMLVKYILAQDKNVLYELLTTRKSFVGWEQKPGVKCSFAELIRLVGKAAPSYNLRLDRKGGEA